MPHVTENLIFSAAGNGDVTMTPIPNQRQRRVCLLGDVLIVVALLLIDHSSCQGKLGCSNKKCLLKLGCFSDGRAVASDTRGANPDIGEFLNRTFVYLLSIVLKNGTNEKEAENGLFEKLGCLNGFFIKTLIEKVQIVSASD